MRATPRSALNIYDEAAKKGEGMIRRLPTFQGYTIDVRLGQFRKVELDEWPEFIPFDSDAGFEIYEKMQDYPEDIQTYQGEHPHDIIFAVYLKSIWG